MSCRHQKLFLCTEIVVLLVTMATSVLGNDKSPASTVCGDATGFNCLFTSNLKEYTNVPVTFDNRVPAWLTGTLIRNGPAMFERGYQSATHLFDGFGKLASWKFLPNGTTLFSTRFIRSGFYKGTMDRDSYDPYLMFNPPNPPFNFLQKKESLLRGQDNMNVNIYDFPKNQSDRDFATFSDFWEVYQVSGKDLSTTRLIKPKLSTTESLLHMNMASSAHPLPEPGTTNRITFLVGQRLFKIMKNQLSLVRMSSVSGRSLIAEWEVNDDVPYMHSFSVSQTKAVLMTGPVTTSSMCVWETASPLLCMVWNNEKPSTLYIADLKSGQKETIIMPKMLFGIHHINAYDVDDGRRIIMDVVCYDSDKIYKDMLLIDTVRNEEKRNKAYVRPAVKRVVIDLENKTAEIFNMSTSSIVTDGLDLPAINERYRSQKYCYVYGANNFADGKSYTSSAVMKKDVCNGGAVVGKLNIPGHYPVEPAFVPDPKGTEEDDGVLLVPMLRGKDAVTYMAVIDAKTMTITSKADMPDFIPITLHGHFYEEYY